MTGAEREIRRLLVGSTLASLGLAAGELLGWLLGWPGMSGTGIFVLRPNTVLALFVGACGVLCLAGPRACVARRALGAALGLATSAFALLNLASYFSTRDIGLDRMLLAVARVGATDEVHGRLLPAAALCFGLWGVGLLFAARGRRLDVIASQVAAIFVGSIVLLELLGYAYGGVLRDNLFSLYLHAPGMRLTCALSLLLLSLALLCLHPEKGLLELFLSPNAGGVVFRRMLPRSLALPFGLTAAAMLGQRLGWYADSFTVAILAVSCLFSLFIPLYMTGLLVDRVDGERKRTEERFKQVFECASWGMVIRRIDDNVVELANRAYARMYGYEPEEMAGMSIEDLVPPRLRPELEENLRILCERGQHSFESEHVRKDGSEFPVSVEATVLRDEAGRPSLVALSIVDITERRRAVQARNIESIGTLAGNIAHDFRSILGLILGSASLLQRGTLSAEKAAYYGKLIRASAERGVSLVNRILTFASRTDIELRSLNVNRTIRELVAAMRESFPSGIRFELLLDEALTDIVADADQFNQIIVNLCVNSRDAMPAGGEIRIRTMPVPGSTLRDRWPDAGASSYVAIRVEDTGNGMSHEVQKRIFEPFFTTKSDANGTGLGLSVVYGAVKRHGGVIDLESDAGQGASFEVFLPYMPPVDAR